MPEPAIHKAELRSELRRRRQVLSAQEQAGAAEAVARRMPTLPGWDISQHIALYLAADGELDPLPLAAVARAQGKTLYLPVIRADNSLSFARWDPGSELVANRYGIPEPPQAAPRQAPGDLDLLFLPLVGWDRKGGRLGMGGGFYDRTLAGIEGPVLVGLAHACQEIDEVPMEPWDTRLDYVATGDALLARGG